MRTHTVLGIKFYGGTSREAIHEISRMGGLLVAPAAPSLINLCRDEEYRRALLASDLAIADSGFMVLLWKLFAGETVPRISGLEHMKRLLEHESVRQPRAVLWVVATRSSREKLLAVSARGQGTASQRNELSSGIPVSEEDIFVAPEYARPVVDETLLEIARQNHPRHIVIAVGGGVQDKLGPLSSSATRLSAGDSLHRCRARISHRRPGPHPRLGRQVLPWLAFPLACPTERLRSAFLECAKTALADLEIQGSAPALGEAREKGE